jgi:hypothetical protein
VVGLAVLFVAQVLVWRLYVGAGGGVARFTAGVPVVSGLHCILRVRMGTGRRGWLLLMQPPVWGMCSGSWRRRLKEVWSEESEWIDVA